MRSTREEEDGATEVLDPQDVLGSILLETIDFEILGLLLEPLVLGSGYQQKDRKPSQNDKTEHGMEKTVQNQGQNILGATTQRDTGGYYPKRYWELLPKEILGATTQRDTGSYYPKRYWELLPKEILGAITQRDTRSYYPKRY
ncbi:hypothetical protein Tco_0766068 [Tanacetum coccineum]